MIISAADQTLFPQFTRYVRNSLPEIANISSMRRAFMRFAQMDRATLLDAVLAHPRLAAYYHRDKLPARLPLQVVNASGTVLPAPSERWAGVACELVAAGAQPKPGRAALWIDKVVLDGSRASAEFRFPVEGLAGTATLQRDAAGAWAVDQLKLVER